MGLLSKALSKGKKPESEGKAKGLLAKALSVSKASERTERSEESLEMAKEEESELQQDSIGLLERAESVMKEKAQQDGEVSVSVETETAQKPGLLKRARQMVHEKGRLEEEAIEEERKGRHLQQPEDKAVQETPEEQFAAEQSEKLAGKGLLAKASLLAQQQETKPGEEAEEETASVALGEGVITDEEIERAQKQGKVVLSENALGEAEVKEKVYPVAKTEEQAASPEIKPQPIPEERDVHSYPELIEYSLYQNEPFKTLELFDESISNEGYQTFFANTLEAFIRICRADSAVLLGFQKDRYSAECVVSDQDLRQRLEKLSLSQDSKLVQRMKQKYTLLEYKDITEDKLLEKETIAFSPLDPWLMIPLNAGDTLIGCVLVGNQHIDLNKRKESLLFLSTIFAQYLNSFLLEEYFHEDIERLSKEKKEIRDFLKLFNYSDVKAKDIDALLELFCSTLGVKSAVIVTGWDQKELLKVQTGIGLSEKGLTRYKISKSDSELQSIINKREPDIPKDIDQKLSRFLKDDKKQVKTYVVVPVFFQEMLLGLLMIHKMKGVGKRLSQKVKKKLLQGAQCFIPFLLSQKLSAIGPYQAFEQLLEREIKHAKETSHTLDIIVFLFQNIQDIFRAYKFENFRYLLDKLLRDMSDVVDGKGMTKLVSLDKIVILLRDLEEEESNTLIDTVQSSFEQAIAREKEKDVLDYQLLTTRYPDEIDDSTDILSIIG